MKLVFVPKHTHCTHEHTRDILKSLTIFNNASKSDLNTCFAHGTVAYHFQMTEVQDKQFNDCIYKFQTIICNSATKSIQVTISLFLLLFSKKAAFHVAKEGVSLSRAHVGSG